MHLKFFVNGKKILRLYWKKHFRIDPGGLVIKNPPVDAGDTRDMGLIPGSGRSPGGGHGNPLQYSCLGNPMGRVAWQAIVFGFHRILDTTEVT